MGVNDYYDIINLSTSSITVDLVCDYFNNRLLVKNYSGVMEEIVSSIDLFIGKHQIQKAIIFAYQKDLQALYAKGFIVEAIINKFFNGADAYYAVKYYSNDRRTSLAWMKEDEILFNVSQYEKEPLSKHLPAEYQLIKAAKNDSEALSELYQAVFNIYPTPLNNPSYIRETMNQKCIYYFIKHKDRMISAAAADLNLSNRNAEITDCATLPSYRKLGCMKMLVTNLEKELMNQHIYHVYSIARALSFGMNKCLHQLGYTYSGRLMNNCYIFNKLEDMNVWVRDLKV